jgi:hypothetical protein
MRWEAYSCMLIDKVGERNRPARSKGKASSPMLDELTKSMRLFIVKSRHSNECDSI